jgi:DNA-binding transcriptional LysR family regulator
MLGFDWAVAGFDSSFQASLSRPLRERLQAQGFPRYRVLNQSACIEMTLRSDVLTLLPATAAAPLIAMGKLEAIAFPGGATLSVAAVTNRAGQPPPIIAAFIDAIRDTGAG